jgi:thiol-disulfide isomerase/thioredoxin
LVLVTLAVVLVAGSGPGASTEQARRAFDFTFEDINPASTTHGQQLELSDLYTDRGLVLQFVASWCKPCRDELPELQQLHAAGNTPILLVAADEYGYTEGILIVAERSGLTAPLLFVPKERTAEMERYYDHEILPSTYLIDREGAIVEVHEGAWSKERLLAAVEKTLD